MAVLKCKMCGGDIIAAENQTYGVCDSCGRTVTLPSVNDQRMENLFKRANHFRMISEFDKAPATYEMILNEDQTSAEAHWGLLLSRYGIEKVIRARKPEEAAPQPGPSAAAPRRGLSLPAGHPLSGGRGFFQHRGISGSGAGYRSGICPGVYGQIVRQPAAAHRGRAGGNGYPL